MIYLIFKLSNIRLLNLHLQKIKPDFTYSQDLDLKCETDSVASDGQDQVSYQTMD